MNSSVADPVVSEECEICLGSLSTHDKTYPLLCPTTCGCNICFNCTSHLVKMRQQQSNHNYYTKTTTTTTSRNAASSADIVMTLCPRCQNDLSYTIEDTFLMRKVGKMQSVITANVPDSELSAAELRFKHSVTPTQIKECQERLEKFQQDIAEGKVLGKEEKAIVVSSSGSSESSSGSNGNRNSNSNSPTSRRRGRRMDELQNKNNNSKSTSPENIHEGKSSKKSSKSLSVFQILQFINCDLFQGIQDVLSKDEQIFIFDLMTSGDIEKLVQSCQILSELRRIHQPTELTTTSSSSTIKRNNKLLSDAEIRAIRTAMSIQERSKIEEVEQYLEWSPLPRLPKFITLEANFDVYAKHGKVLKFRDDGWDGSVSDAFARAYTISNHQDVNGSFESDVSGFHHDEEDGFINSNDNGRKKTRDNRVIIYAARKQAAAAGISIGDVVTHIDGNEFLGTAKELRELIQGLYTRGNQMFTMVLNAEQITADALKDFALALKR